MILSNLLKWKLFFLVVISKLTCCWAFLLFKSFKNVKRGSLEMIFCECYSWWKSAHHDTSSMRKSQICSTSDPCNFFLDGDFCMKFSGFTPWYVYFDCAEFQANPSNLIFCLFPPLGPVCTLMLGCGSRWEGWRGLGERRFKGWGKWWPFHCDIISGDGDLGLLGTILIRN